MSENVIGNLTWEACLACSEYSEEEGCTAAFIDLENEGDSVLCLTFEESAP